MTERSSKRKCVPDAQAEAERIINDANAEAERIIDEARTEAQEYKNHATTAAQNTLDEAQEKAEEIVRDAQKTADMIVNQVKQAKHDLIVVKEQLTCYRTGYEALQATDLNELRDQHVEALKKIRQAELMLCAKALLCQYNPDMACPLSGEVMKDPVLAADDHSYERAFILEWIKKKGVDAKSPMIGVPLANFELRKNWTLKKIITHQLEQLVSKQRILHQHTDLLTSLIVTRSPSTASSIAYDAAPLQVDTRVPIPGIPITP